MDIAELGIKIDSSSASVAVGALDKLRGAAGATEAATSKLTGAASKTRDALGRFVNTGADTGLKKVDAAAKQTTATIVGLGAGADSMAAKWAALAAQNSRTASATEAAGAAMAGVETNTSALAAELVAAQQEAAAYAAEMDAIRAKYNPLFAASKQYEMALQEIAEAERMGAITSREAAAARDRAAAGLVRVGDATQAAAKGSIFAGNAARMMGMQLSQVGQQTMASGNFIQALAIQLPDIGLGFGAVGMAAGLLAGIALPMVASAFGDTATTAEATTDALDDLTAAANAYIEAATAAALPTDELITKYGTLASAAREAQDALAAATLAEATISANEAVDTLLNNIATTREYVVNDMLGAAESFLVLKDTVGLTYDQVGALNAALQALDSAKGLREQAAAAQEVNRALLDAYGSVNDMPAPIQEAYAAMARLTLEASAVVGQTEKSWLSARNLKDMLNDAATAAASIVSSAPGSGWLSDAIADAGTLAAKLWDAAAAAAAAQGSGAVDDRNMPTPFGEGSRARNRPRRAPVEGTASWNSPPKTRGGGGGGKADGYKADLEALVESLQTERETLDQWYEDGQKILEDRRALELLGEEEHKAAKLALEQDYQAQLREIQDQGYEMERAARTAAFSEAETLLSLFAGKSKTAAIAAIALNKGLRIAEIIQNTAAASMRAIAELGPIAGPPMAAKIAMWGKVQAGIVAATGLAQAASAGGGGSFGSGSTPAQGAASGEVAGPQTRLVIQGINANDIFTGKMLMDMLGEELQARGVEFIR